MAVNGLPGIIGPLLHRARALLKRGRCLLPGGGLLLCIVGEVLDGSRQQLRCGGTVHRGLRKPYARRSRLIPGALAVRRASATPLPCRRMASADSAASESTFPMSVGQSRPTTGSPWLDLPFTSPSPSGREGIGGVWAVITSGTVRRRVQAHGVSSRHELRVRAVRLL